MLTDLKNCFSYKTQDIFSLKQTFECGQCFRWDRIGDEEYRGVAFGREVTFKFFGDTLYSDCTEEEFSQIWLKYFDFDRDYAKIRELVSIDERTAESVSYGAGIRILRQEPWEALCSFIISQCNNIPRIKGIIDRLCKLCGTPAGESFAFPTAEQVASLGVDGLAPLRCGYRAPYIHDAACKVASGELDLDELSRMPTAEAKKILLKHNGIGEKVASCVLLFGLGKMDAFPVDTWMKKAVAELYGKGFDPAAAFGEWAGIAQQYIFYHARETRLYTK